MASAGGPKNPYGVDSDPFRKVSSADAQQVSGNNLNKRQQKQSLADAANEEDPISKAVRSALKLVRGK